MDTGSKNKARLLGMPIGTASNRLRKSLVYDLWIKLNGDRCYRCGEPINSPDEMSIEHKEPWQSALDPVVSFFDLGNVSISHLSCNVREAERSKPTAGHGASTTYGKRGCRCEECRQWKSEVLRRHRAKLRMASGPPAKRSTNAGSNPAFASSVSIG